MTRAPRNSPAGPCSLSIPASVWPEPLVTPLQGPAPYQPLRLSDKRPCPSPAGAWPLINPSVCLTSATRHSPAEPCSLSTPASVWPAPLVTPLQNPAPYQPLRLSDQSPSSLPCRACPLPTAASVWPEPLVTPLLGPAPYQPLLLSDQRPSLLPCWGLLPTNPCVCLTSDPRYSPAGACSLSTPASVWPAPIATPVLGPAPSQPLLLGICLEQTEVHLPDAHTPQLHLTVFAMNK